MELEDDIFWVRERFIEDRPSVKEKFARIVVACGISTNSVQEGDIQPWQWKGGEEP